MTFERTSDPAVVRSFLTEPSIWPFVGDDAAGDRATFQPNMDERIVYLRVIFGGAMEALVAFIPRSFVRYEVHISVKASRPSVAGFGILPDAFRWMWEHTDAQRIIAEVPTFNRLAANLARRVMQKTGRDEKAFMKNGKLHDLELFGISKPGGE